MDDDTVAWLFSLAAVVAVICGAFVGLAWLVGQAAHFVVTYGPGILMWLAIALARLSALVLVLFCLSVLAMFLVDLFRPPVRRTAIRLYWWRRGAAQQRRYRRARRDLRKAYEQTRQRIAQLGNGGK